MDSKLIIIIFVGALLILQAIGGYLQIRDFRRAVSRMHGYGNIGIGQKRGFFSSYLVIIACDGDGIIVRMEVLGGAGIAARFREKSTIDSEVITGRHIKEVIDRITPLLKGRKGGYYAGYHQALTALMMRLYPDDGG